MDLTKNFTLAELVRSDIATRKGIPNIPSDVAVANLKLLAEKVLQPIRDHYNKAIRINSGYRSINLNIAVGGSRSSDHCKGYAADIEIPGVSNVDLAEHIKTSLKFTQLILEFYTLGDPSSGWVHVSYNPKELKCQVLTATKQNGKSVYLNGLVKG